MYDFTESLETNASLEDVWAVYTDVRGWLRWMPHLRDIRFTGPFAAGSAGAAIVDVGLETEVKFALENVEPMKRFEVVWTVGPLLHTRMTHSLERTTTGTRITHAYHTGGVMAPFNFLQASAAHERARPAMEAIAALASGAK